MSLNNKVAIVTGASSGIGAATAIIFAREGASVVLVGRNEANLRNVAEKCGQAGRKGLFIATDITKDEGIAHVIEKTVETFGRLDILVNNAGVWRHTPILDTNFGDAFDEITNINLRAAVMLTNKAAPHLIKTKGNVVNVSSILGSVPLSGYSIYCALKAGLNHFSRVAAAELGDKGVRVNIVSPGPVETPFFGISGDDITWENLKSKTVLNKISKPEDIGEMIAYTASDKARCVTGSDLIIDCGVFVKK